MVALTDQTARSRRNGTATTEGLQTSALERFVESRTFGQVADLHVIQETDRVLLLGHSRSYYVKQLATHAVLEFLPQAHLENAIDVR